MEKTDKAVINYLDAMKDRLSGNALKIAFAVVMMWRDSEAEWIYLTYDELVKQTNLSRGTVKSVLGEAKALKAIDRKGKQPKYRYRPNFERVRILDAEIENKIESGEKVPKPLEITERLFWHWQQIYAEKGAQAVYFSRDRRRCARRVLNKPAAREILIAYRRSLKALKGYFFTGSEMRNFEEIFASLDTVQKGIVRYEFLRTRETQEK